MEPKRRDYFLTFTILGLAASVLMGFQYIGSVLYVLAEEWAVNQEAGIFCRLSWLFHSPWTDMLVQYAFTLGGAYPIIWLMLCRIPKFKTEAYRLTLEEFMVCLVASMGMGYVLNFLGNFINMAVSMFNGKSFLEMNPVIEMTVQLSPSLIIYACILGPFMEELMFRGMLLKRARRFGDRTAVIYTAVLFGLMHGNVSQFLYGAFIGIILGYVAVKTDSIRYTVIMHIMINSYGMIMTAGESLLESAGLYGGMFLYSVAFFAGLIFIVIGAVIVLKKYGKLWYRQLTWNNGIPSPYKKYVYLNPGFFLFLYLCIIEIRFYLM